MFNYIIFTINPCIDREICAPINETYNKINNEIITLYY